ncbi:hypothetical protein AB0K48_41790 [Nonomuraea sp. NPDC055795]
MAVLVACAVAAVLLPGPGWARWIVAGVAGLIAAGFGIALLIGLVARGLAGQSAPPDLGGPVADDHR